MDTKEIITIIKKELGDMKNSIENRVENIVGEKHFHAEILWGIVISSVLAVLVGSSIALYVWRNEAKIIVNSQLELLEVKQEQMIKVLEEKVDSLKEKISDMKGDSDE